MAGNWKMNLNFLEAIALVQKLDFTLKAKDYEACDVVLLVPFTDIRSVQTLVDGDHLSFSYGAQDVSSAASGAYTGEVSASMLTKLGCTHVIVGHSERRDYHGETDAQVAAKALAAIGAGMTPIVCVGEKELVRESGGHVTHNLEMLTGSLAGISTAQMAGVVVAYEPVWAIGTGLTATPDDAQEVCAALRAHLAQLYDAATAKATRILYGGSMKAGNAADLMKMPDVDGGLVGGASLDSDEFAAIVRAAA